jgi:hypothetical protein
MSKMQETYCVDILRCERGWMGQKHLEHKYFDSEAEAKSFSILYNSESDLYATKHEYFFAQYQ